MPYVPANDRKKDNKYFSVKRGKQCLNRAGLANMKKLSKEMTYEEVARKMGVSSSTVAAFMRGSVKLAK